MEKIMKLFIILKQKNGCMPTEDRKIISLCQKDILLMMDIISMEILLL
jgi:hypothetical protein